MTIIILHNIVRTVRERKAKKVHPAKNHDIIKYMKDEDIKMFIQSHNFA